MRKYSVLIVEDERIVAMDLQQMLTALGYDAYAIASSANEAFARASEKRPDVILMDIRIKGQLDGIRTAAILREKFDVPLVYLTAHADDATIARAKKTAPHGYLLKPVKTTELKSAIEVSIYRHEMEKDLRSREALLRDTLASIEDGIVTLDSQSRIVQMNAAAETLTGWKHAEAKGKSLVLLLCPKAGDRSVDAALGTELPDRVEAVLNDGLTRHGEGAEGPTGRSFGYSITAISDRIGRTVGAVLHLHDITEQRRSDSEIRGLHAHLAELATTDELTGVGNYRAFKERLRQMVAEGERGRAFAMVLCDVDDFKRINDGLGHRAGDQALVEVARALKDNVRETDFVARCGGDEFCILFTDVSEEAAVALTERLRQSIASIREPSPVTASFGLCAYSKSFDGNTAAFVDAVDAALYQSKREGRNRVACAPRRGAWS
ncbi:diguanylate cyclase domain-containing protein [Pendulispora albinea]|uniref:diguanylate cyclase n=1 Tax=Pendulispora albinea TaxID=2741071 RepID=A0ABZ2LYX2_9BACT